MQLVFEIRATSVDPLAGCFARMATLEGRLEIILKPSIRSVRFVYAHVQKREARQFLIGGDCRETYLLRAPRVGRL